MEYSVKTFGCKVNTYDTALLQKQLNQKKIFKKQNENYQNFQYHIVNTCAVTDQAIKDSLKWIQSFKKKYPQTKIVVTGCGSQVEIHRYQQSSSVDLVIANSHKHQLTDILEKYSKGEIHQRVFHSNIFKKTDKGEGGSVESRHTRLFLKIQDGCSQFCTFCVIPFARGKSQSLSTTSLVRQINQTHQDQGVMEAVLTGVHIGDYQDPETKKGLDYLVEMILKNTKIPRIRLSSLEPIELTPTLFNFYKDPRMCPHFHLSIQSGNSKVLKNMKRRYSQKEVRSCLENIHKNLPSAFVGMDIIAGFAGESQKDFEETYELFKNSPWTQMHVFPYSQRPSTYALRMKDHHPSSVIVRRARLLRDLSHQRFHQQARLQIGKVKDVLPLKQAKGISRDYWSVDFNSSSFRTNFKSDQELKAQLVYWNEDTKKFTAKII